MLLPLIGKEHPFQFDHPNTPFPIEARREKRVAKKQRIAAASAGPNADLHQTGPGLWVLDSPG